MTKGFAAIEKIRPHVFDGQIVKTDKWVEYVRSSDGHRATFPMGSEIYLQLFSQKNTIQEIVQNHSQSGIRINFALLKETLSTLYWSGNLANAADFAAAIEDSDGIPVNGGHLIHPFVEWTLESENIFFQLVIYAFSAAIIFLTGKIYLEIAIPAFSILLFPQFFLNLKGAGSDFINTLFGRKSQALALHLSPLGIYLRQATGPRSSMTATEYLMHFVLILALGTASWIFFNQYDEAIFRQFGPTLILLLLSISFSPAHNTDFSNFLQSATKDSKKGKPCLLASLLTTISKAIFIASTSIFAVKTFLSAWAAFNGADRFAQIVSALLICCAIALIFDLLESSATFFSRADLSKTDSLEAKLRNPLRRRHTTHEMSEVIAAIPLFQGLPTETLKEMARASEVVNLRTGFRVFRSGSSCTDLYVVISGRIGIYKRKADGTKERIVSIPAGSIFGEGGFLLNRPRAGDAIAMANTILLRIKRPPGFESVDSTQIEKMHLFQKRIWAFQALANSELFKDAPAELVMDLVVRGKIVEAATQRVIFNQGDLPDSLYVIIQGALQSVQGTRVLRTMKAGDVFGEIGVLWNSHRTTSIVAIAPSLLLRIDAAKVWEVLSNNLNLGVAIQEIGKERLKPTAPAASVFQ
jgi:CRP-like cAMP-binding protein